MNISEINRILSDTAYVRVGGSKEELECAEYIKSICARMGLEAVIEPFDVRMYAEDHAELLVDGREISCKSYFGAASGTVRAKLYYLEDTSPVSLSKCRGKIVLVDKAMGYKLYDQITEHGAVGFITYSGNVNFSDKDIDRKEIRFEVEKGKLIQGVNIHISDAVDMIRSGASMAEIRIEQRAFIGNSHNVILDLDGESGETVTVSAHYDSTALSTGAYDNMSGCIGLIYLAEYFRSRPHRRRIRFLWCGSEERGLLGSYEYCRGHSSELENTVLNINLDMLGSLMGGFVAFSCADEDMANALEKFMSKRRFSGTVRYDIRSSDSNSFVFHGVPAVSFARYAPSGAALIHSRYDTAEVMSAKRLLDDMKFIAKFTEYVANEPDFPQTVSISEKISSAVDAYFTRRSNKKLQ